jgi:hypothetical protein
VSLGGFLLLFVAIRLLYLLLIHPSYLSPQLEDELYVGTIAQELSTGLTMHFAEYRASNYMLGTLVIGALAAGFFWLLGPTLFALKLASLLVFTLALVFWYWTIRHAAGERVAGYFGVLFCFSPPLLTAYSVAALGDHSQSIVFSALTVLLIFRMLSEEKPSPAYPVLLGLTAGFGLWFAYIYGLTLLALLGFWFWHDKGKFWRPRVLWFALGLVVGFSPWIIFNVQTHFAGLVIHGINVWEHFGLQPLWDSLAHPRELAPVEFLRTIASDDSWDLYRRSVNLLYTLLYLVPIVTVGVLHLRTRRPALAEARPNRPTLVGFSILYLILFVLAVQFSDFKYARYNVPAYPFLFLLVALALARCQDAFPLVQKKMQTIFLASVVVLGLGAHAPLMSLDRPGYALSAKGYSYAWMPWHYWWTHAQAGSVDREFIPHLVQRPFLSSILPKLAADDQRELSLAILGMLTYVAPFNGRVEDFARIERLVPPGYDTQFYYSLGVVAMDLHPNEFSQAVAAVEFLRHRTPAMHHLALIGIYQSWPGVATLDKSPEAVVNSPAVVVPELSPHYWRALGHWAGRYWYENERSLGLLNARVRSFVPRLDHSVQRSFLQGVGQTLFAYPGTANWLPPAELERFPHAYQPSLFEGWGMALGEDELFSLLPWKGLESPNWTAWTKGLSEKNIASIKHGKAQFDALFERPASSVVEQPRHAP